MFLLKDILITGEINILIDLSFGTTIICLIMVIGLISLIQGLWEGHTGILLLSPQQIGLGIIIDQFITEIPRTMVDLINLHGNQQMIHKAGSSHL